MNYQEQLKSAYNQHQFKEFKNSLKNGAKAEYSTGDEQSIFEKLLSRRSQYNRPHFLNECLCHGCDVNYVNKELNKAAINYAVESLKFSNIFTLLYHNENVTINVNFKFEELTPLNYLAKFLSASNIGEVGECMEMLLLNGALVNTSEKNGLVPLKYILESNLPPSDEKYEIIYSLMSRYTEKDSVFYEAWAYLKMCNLDRHKELRRYSFDKFTPKSHFSEEDSTDKKSKRIKYLMKLMDRYIEDDYKQTLYLLPQICQINSDKDNVDIILKALRSGNETLVESLIEAENLQLSSAKSVELLETAIKSMPADTSNRFYCNYIKCFQLLLKANFVDVNGVKDDQIPPLGYAANVCNETAVKELLKNGAYMGMRSDYRELPIVNIRPEILEEHLDHCITMNGVKSRDKNITINLTNVSHPLRGANSQLAYNDMKSISYIRRTKDLYHLLQHPVVTCLLVHKWQQFSKFFYIHFAIYCIFQMLITVHIISRFPNHNLEKSSNVVVVPCLLLTFYLLVREIVQFFLGWQNYLRLFAINILDLTIILLSTLACFGIGSDDTQSVIATYTILLTAIKLLLLMSSLHLKFISLPLLMLLEVCRTVAKYIFIFFFLLLIFSICFYIRFSLPTTKKPINESESLSVNFDNFYSALAKTYIMSTGEYDAGNIQFKSSFDYLWLILFSILVGIAFFNLLTGLAVSDIQMIKDQADIYKAISRINLLTSCEAFLNQAWWHNPKFKWLKDRIKPKESQIYKITIPQYEYPHKMTPHFYKAPMNPSDPLSISSDKRGDTTCLGKIRNENSMRSETNNIKTEEPSFQHLLSKNKSSKHTQFQDLNAYTTINVDQPAKSPGGLFQFTQTTHYVAKLFRSTFSDSVDEEIFKRARIIAEKRSTEKSNIDLEECLKLLQNSLKYLDKNNLEHLLKDCLKDVSLNR